MEDRIAMAEEIVGVLRVYVGIGLAVAVALALFVAPRIDPGARFDRTAPIGSVIFRVLILPAATLLWPIVIFRAAWIWRSRSVGEGSR